MCLFLPILYASSTPEARTPSSSCPSFFYIQRRCQFANVRDSGYSLLPHPGDRSNCPLQAVALASHHGRSHGASMYMGLAISTRSPNVYHLPTYARTITIPGRAGGTRRASHWQAGSRKNRRYHYHRQRLPSPGSPGPHLLFLHRDTISMRGGAARSFPPALLTPPTSARSLHASFLSSRVFFVSFFYTGSFRRPRYVCACMARARCIDSRESQRASTDQWPSGHGHHHTSYSKFLLRVLKSPPRVGRGPGTKVGTRFGLRGPTWVTESVAEGSFGRGPGWPWGVSTSTGTGRSCAGDMEPFAPSGLTRTLYKYCGSLLSSVSYQLHLSQDVHIA